MTLCVIRMSVPQSDVQVREILQTLYLSDICRMSAYHGIFFSPPPHPHFDWAEVQSPVLLGLPVDS